MKRSREDEIDVDLEVELQSGGDGPGFSSLETIASAYLESVKLEAPSDLYAKFLLLLKDFKAGRIDAAYVVLQIKNLFVGYKDLIVGFNVFLPERYKISLDDDEDDENRETDLEGEKDEKLNSDKFEEAIRFVNNVKLRFRNSDEHVFYSFLDIWAPSRKKVINIDDYYKAAQLLSDHPDLLQDFDRLLGFAQKASDTSDASCGKITSDYLKTTVTGILESDDDRSLVEEFNNFLKTPEEGKKEQKQIKSVYELDLSKCKKISHSYWLLPKAYRVSSSIKRSEDDAVLNDKFVCLSLGGGNYSFKHKPIQQHEEFLFKCEDDRYEMDMLMENIRSAIEKVKKLLNAIKENNICLEIEFCIEDHLSIFNRRCIERLYGDYGLEMMGVLQEKPIRALPVILKRLEQKQQELTQYRGVFNKLCPLIYAKNFLKKPAVKQQKLSKECSLEEFNDKKQQKWSKECSLEESNNVAKFIVQQRVDEQALGAASSLSGHSKPLEAVAGG